MDDLKDLPSRKSDHIRINLDEDVQSFLTSGLERYQFIHHALPELNLDQVSLDQQIFQKHQKIPILISSMTGGTEEAERINRNLAIAAQVTGAAMGLGSQRAAIEHPDLVATFQIRKYAPDILLFANLGAVQLNYGYTIDQCRRAVEMVNADALILHLNPLQEAVQSGGNTRFSGLLEKISRVCRQLHVPVIVKEVGWGISEETARQLASAGVAAIDIAGAGGTSWSQVEMYRAKNSRQAQIAEAFRGWGISTSESLLQARIGAPQQLIFASGGLRNGIDIAKCIALGAVLGGMAGPILKAAVDGEEDTIALIEDIVREIQIVMFLVGAARISDLQTTPLTIENSRR